MPRKLWALWLVAALLLYGCAAGEGAGQPSDLPAEEPAEVRSAPASTAVSLEEQVLVEMSLSEYILGHWEIGGDSAGLGKSLYFYDDGIYVYFAGYAAGEEQLKFARGQWTVDEEKKTIALVSGATVSAGGENAAQVGGLVLVNVREENRQGEQLALSKVNILTPSGSGERWGLQLGGLLCTRAGGMEKRDQDNFEDMKSGAMPRGYEEYYNQNATEETHTSASDVAGSSGSASDTPDGDSSTRDPGNTDSTVVGSWQRESSTTGADTGECYIFQSDNTYWYSASPYAAAPSDVQRWRASEGFWFVEDGYLFLSARRYCQIAGGEITEDVTAGHTITGGTREVGEIKPADRILEATPFSLAAGDDQQKLTIGGVEYDSITLSDPALEEIKNRYYTAG